MIDDSRRPASKISKRAMAEYDELWFSEEFPFGTESGPPAVSQQEFSEELLMMVDSIDAEDTEESLKLGICVESLNECQRFRQIEKCPQTPPSYPIGRPKTPPTTKPSFHELPPIISPEYFDRDSTTGFPIDDAFEPPPHHFAKVAYRQYQPRHHSYPQHRHNPSLALDPYERSCIDKMAHCMRRSHASRREILRRRQFFGNHPALYEFERLEGSHRKVWMFISSQQQLPSGYR